ncbi:hypothetical protein [Stenotrophomonas acidaminiphila]|uniref:hypothetical protein n=1 Tax=Stenotrophomonas acidaminiphila TaxID=128780 RepID=UPI0015F94A46|nr:hypothetical protein [Stenotrophomonas acidaminiphila]
MNTIAMTTHRRNQLIALRNRLNDLGEPMHYFIDTARDTIPANGGAWNRKRVRIRNKINSRLRVA